MNQEQISALLERYQVEAVDAIPFPVAPAAKIAVNAIRQYGGDETALLEELERRAAEDERANKKYPANRLYAAFEQRAARLREIAGEIRRELGLAGQLLAAVGGTTQLNWIWVRLNSLSLRVQVLRQLLQHAEGSTDAPGREVWEFALDAIEELLNTGLPWTKAGEGSAEALRNYLRVASGDQVVVLLAEVAALTPLTRDMTCDLVGAAARARLDAPREEA